MTKTCGTLRLNRSIRGRRGGTATVELAMILPLLVMLLFATLEVGVMVRCSHNVSHMARDGARMASIGACPTRIAQHLGDSGAGLDARNLSVTLEHRSWDEHAGSWGNWIALAANGDGNTASPGDQLRVTLQYDHPLIMGGMFAEFLQASEDNNVSVDSTVVTLRQ